jgi:hypothetical protein
VAVSFIPRLALSHAPGTTHRALEAPGLARRIHAVIPDNTEHAPLTAVFLGMLRQICAELDALP